MQTSLLRYTTLTAFSLLMLASMSRVAEARRGFVLVTYGDTIEKVADIVPELREQATSEVGPDACIGYKYGAVGAFWLDLWTWGGTYVIYDGHDSYSDAPPEVIAELAGVADVSELGKPWQYRFPPLLILLIVGIIGYIGFKWITRDKNASYEDGDGDQSAEPEDAAAR